jgi:hypothetical protein
MREECSGGNSLFLEQCLSAKKNGVLHAPVALCLSYVCHSLRVLGTSELMKGIEKMAPILSRRTVLRQGRNLLFLLPIGGAFFVEKMSQVTTSAFAASQAYTWKSVVTGGGGGFVADIIFNHKQQNLIYARTDIGGAYRWNQATSTWTQLLNWVSTLQQERTPTRIRA